jgi:Tfp pilus assembly protein PilO
MPMLVETIMKSSKVSRGIISFSIVAIVGFVTYNWAVSPQISYVNAAQQYEALSHNLEKKTKIMSNAVRIKNIKVQLLHTEIQSSSVRFFSRDQADVFFAQLEKISTVASCDLNSLVFQSETFISVESENNESALVTEKKAHLKIEGTYHAIVDFAAAMKEYPLTVCLESLKLELKKSDTNKLSCSMDLKVYLTEDKELLSNE